MTNEKLWEIYEWYHTINPDKYPSWAKIIEKSNRVWIKERRWSENENSLDLAYKSVENLKKKYWDKVIDWVDWIYVWSLTAPAFFPTIAPQLAQQLWIHKVEAFDVMNACPSFLNGMMAADRAIRCWDLSKVLVVWTDVMSWMVKDFNYKTGILFWDGAWAVILEPTNNEYGIQGSQSLNFSQSPECLLFRTQFFNNQNDNSKEIFNIDWPSVYEMWVDLTTNMILDYCKKKWINIHDFKWIIPHQANERMLNKISDNIGINYDIMIKNLSTNGNTAAASIPLAMSQFSDKFQTWDRILLISFWAWFSLALVDLIWEEKKSIH